MTEIKQQNQGSEKKIGFFQENKLVNTKPLRVMIVDDDPRICALLEAFLKIKEVDSVAFQSPLAALRELELSSEISLILLDIIMPEMSGLEMLKQLRKFKPDLPVIMITAQQDINVAKECLETGAKDYITKPIDFEYLETSVLAELLTSD